MSASGRLPAPADTLAHRVTGAIALGDNAQAVDLLYTALTEAVDRTGVELDEQAARLLHQLAEMAGDPPVRRPRAPEQVRLTVEHVSLLVDLIGRRRPGDPLPRLEPTDDQ